LAALPLSTDEEIEALDAICDRMAAFDDHVSLEWLDGYMTALVAGPRRMEVAEWLPVFAGGVFDRTFADPVDAAPAVGLLEGRWKVLQAQLDPEAILEDTDVLRVVPLMVEITEEDKERLVAEGHVKPEELTLLEQTGEVWAHGFMEATRDFPKDWPEPDMETEEGQIYDECLARVVALTLDEEELRELKEEIFPEEDLTRDELVHEACYAAQDLRLYWLDHAPKPPQRRVEKLPGRNDPCPCGSGKKFKKCHGAQMH